ncbi:MAG: response regulator transcription factor [Bryobacteraceae bacterium]
MIRIAIAAASAVVRAGLESLLASAPGLEVVGAFADTAGLDALRPDVFLLAGNATLASGGPAVVLTNEDQPAWTADALRSGVRALLPRDASPAAILAAIDAAAGGMALIDPQELESLLAASAPAQAMETAAAPVVALTPRELEVLRMMADGAANKEIAWKLGISEHTVKFHVASILGKLDAGSRTEAVTRGLRSGLILI